MKSGRKDAGILAVVRRIMRQKWTCLMLTVVGMACWAGCANGPPPVGSKPSSRCPAAGTSVRFDEVMAAAPVEGAHQVYQNLHVGLAAVIDPRKGGVCD